MESKRARELEKQRAREKGGEADRITDKDRGKGNEAIYEIYGKVMKYTEIETNIYLIINEGQGEEGHGQNNKLTTVRIKMK